MRTIELAELGRTAFDNHEWAEAFARLKAAEHGGGLAIEDLERLALSAYLIGEEDASSEAWTRAHKEALQLGDAPRAARNALWHASGLIFKGDMAPAMGWVARAARVLEDAEVCAESAWVMVITNVPRMFQGDPAGAFPAFVEAGEIAERFGDDNVIALSRLARGQALTMQGLIDQGMALLDEVMVAVTAGEVSPIVSGIVYCSVIDACRSVFDVRRAAEWTAALTRWCDTQPDLVPFRGNCLVHRCQIFRLQGAWADAADAAERARDWLAMAGRTGIVGNALYELAEIQRLRGQFAEAEESYKRASQAGRDPEPGLSLLRLAQGRLDVAVAALSRALDEAQGPPNRTQILPAYIEAMIAAGDLSAARAGAEELESIAQRVDAAFLRAEACHALGAVALAEGDVRTALGRLREACAAWRDLEAPYEAARVRVLIARACRELGDHATAQMEVDAARSVFVQLDTEPELERLPGTTTAHRTAAGLTSREVEVLRLVAAGKSNKAVAAELVLSEKTVARHVSNIFVKLGVSSRSAATAYAYEHDLV